MQGQSYIALLKSCIDQRDILKVLGIYLFDFLLSSHTESFKRENNKYGNSINKQPVKSIFNSYVISRSHISSFHFLIKVINHHQNGDLFENKSHPV